MAHQVEDRPVKQVATKQEQTKCPKCGVWSSADRCPQCGAHRTSAEIREDATAEALDSYGR
jgi:ribosomal protein L32